MNILICDDIKNEADMLDKLIAGSGFDAAVTIFQSGQETLDYMRSGAAVDVCFLDILMPGLTGVALADKLRGEGYSGEIVFLTSSNDYAHQAFKVNAFDYLLKPPVQEDVNEILNKLDNARRNADRDGIFIKTGGKSRFILLRDISHIEVIDHTVHVRLINKNKIEVYATFNEIAPLLLKDRRFVRCHRSYVLNMSDIGSVTPNEVVMQSGARIPISRGFSKVKDEMLRWMFEENRK